MLAFPAFHYTCFSKYWLDVAGFGLDGAAWAVNAVQLTSTIGIGGYIIWRERQLRGTEMQTWHGW